MSMSSIASAQDTFGDFQIIFMDHEQSRSGNLRTMLSEQRKSGCGRGVIRRRIDVPLLKTEQSRSACAALLCLIVSLKVRCEAKG